MQKALLYTDTVSGRGSKKKAFRKQRHQCTYLCNCTGNMPPPPGRAIGRDKSKFLEGLQPSTFILKKRAR